MLLGGRILLVCAAISPKMGTATKENGDCPYAGRWFDYRGRGPEFPLRTPFSLGGAHTRFITIVSKLVGLFLSYLQPQLQMSLGLVKVYGVQKYRVGPQTFPSSGP